MTRCSIGCILQNTLDLGLTFFLINSWLISSLKHILMVKLLGTRSQLVIDCPDWSESSVKDGLRRFYQFGSVHMVIP